jgi:adenosylcobyric acid synthase
LEDLTKLPVVGVLPFHDITLEEEDSVALEQKRKTGDQGKINVAVVLLKRMSNFTDFDVLENDPRVHLYYTSQPAELGKADIIIIPGSKNTLADLIDLKNSGAAQALRQAYARGKKVIGICGGYQMLGQSVADPAQVEGEVEYMSGLGLLPVKTTIEGQKTTRQGTFRYRNYPELCRGYEIHMGQTETMGPLSPVNTLADGRSDGYWLNERCWGTYLHGILDNPVVVEDLLRTVGTGNRPTPEMAFNYQAFKEQQYDRLADWLRENLDIAYMLREGSRV